MNSKAESSKGEVERFLLTGSSKFEPWVITPYHWPDLDGIACAIALEEFLRRVGYSRVQAMIWQTPQIEAGWVMNQLELRIPPLTLSGNENICLVDTSDPADIPSFIDPARVKVIVDHRAYHRADCFVNALAQIETVGAASTLIAEFFQHQSVVPSRKSATALFAGIASNTANFKAASTTDRDVAAANRLLDIAVDGKEFVERMFTAKSDFANIDMMTVIDRDLSSTCRSIAGMQTAIAQLEGVGIEALLRERFDEIISSLVNLKDSRSAERIFLLALDLHKGKTYFVFPDTGDRALVEPLLNLSDRGGFFSVDQIVTRKELTANLLRI